MSRSNQLGALVFLALICGCTAPAEGPREMPDWEPQIRAANQALLNEGDLDQVSDFFSEAYVSHGPEGDARGHDAIRGFVSSLRDAFPDLDVDVQVLATEGDRVAWLRTHTGTHQGEVMGVEPSGERLTWQSVVVTRYEDGLIAEEWGANGLGNALLTR